MPEAGGTARRAKETLSWKMCGPITLLQRGGEGGKVLLKMAREPQKELQLSPGSLARCQPRDRRRSGRCAAQGRRWRGCSCGPGRPRNAGYFYIPAVPAIPAPHTRSRFGRSHAGEPRGQRRAAARRPPCALCITVNLGVGACPRVFLGRKELQGLGRELEEGCK